MAGSKGNQNRTIHGGEAGLSRLQDGGEFTGLARQEQEQVESDLDTIGTVGLVRQAAVRLQTVANLFWHAIEKAVNDGDIPALDRYAQRFGWLQNSATRTLLQLAEMERERGVITPSDVLDAIRNNGNE